MTPNKTAKRRLVTSFQNLTPELQAQVKEHYPLGFTDAMMRIDKPNGDFFYAVPFETEEIFYLVKIAVKIDDSENMEKDLFADEIVEAESMGKGDEVAELDSDEEI
ncbi:MAG: hypothetical protein R3Y44_06910 [Rikenellaceae bacterium]